MRFTDISIDGFGVLNDLEISKLTDGLNVVYGTNGSGKTTVMHFLRGVLGGFSDSRRLRLLPPINGGSPGGSVTVQYGNGTYEVIRRTRSEHADTLAINLKSGQSPEAEQLRHEIEALDQDLLKTVFAVGGFESHAVNGMVKMALRDNIELTNRRQHAEWLNSQIHNAEQQRNRLFNQHPESGTISDLEQKRSRLAAAIEMVQSQQFHKQGQWAVAIERLRNEIARLQEEANWLHQELQLAQTELTEVNDRLWSKRESVVYDQHTVERPAVTAVPNWVEEIRVIDAEIAHAQQVLRDLATSRMELSIAKAGLTGAETPDHDVVFERHRQAINAIEDQTQRLQGVLTRIESATRKEECVCNELQGTMGTTLESIRQQISLLCQELSRQQTTHEQLLLNSQVEGVDRCEIELTRQIQRLRIRRDEILHGGQRSMPERIQYCTKHETQYCSCEEHQQYLSTLPSPMVETQQAPEIVTTERIVTTSNARSGDPDRQSYLIARVKQLRGQWWHCNTKLRDAKAELVQLELEPTKFAQDQSVQKARYEYAVVEQQLADAREQWQSLAVLQSVLTRTQAKLTVETHSQVIEDASQLLNRMTEGHYVAFKFYDEPHNGFGPNELVVISDSGSELPMHALSRGTLDQAALSFRMALWAEYRRRGVNLPLILDDVLPDSDESRLQSAVSALVEFGNQHHQMLFFTCQEHLANMFEAMQVRVWDLPGSTRKQVAPIIVETKPEPAPQRFIQVETPPPVIIEAAPEPIAPTPAAVEPEPVAEADAETVTMYRVQPDEPYWLQTNSPASYVPSLGAQMARRLGSLGVRHVSELIDLDAEATEFPLQNLQISPETLRVWQAEARLLCCVPDLTGRDAQLLVACGITSAEKLAEADANALFDRIQIVRSEHSSGALSWLSDRPRWPQRDAVSNWIRRGRSARSYRQARDWSNSRRQRSHSNGFRSRSSRNNNGQRSKSNRSQREYSDRDRTPREYESRSRRSGRSDREDRPHREERTRHERQEFVEREVSDDTEREWKFYLHMDSPVVDAPTIGPRMSDRLEKIGVHTVSDLVNRDAADIAEKLKHKRTSAENVVEWQQQAILVCRIPQLRGHDAQVLVACGVTEPEIVAASTPEDLFAIVGPFANSKDGQRLLRSAKTPDLEEVTDWITFAQNSRLLKVA